MSLKRKILIGSDPELFLKDVKTGRFISAHDKLQGTKEHPFKVDYGAVQVDGVAAEFNTDPSETSRDFVVKHGIVMAKLQEIVGAESLLTITPTATFDPEYFASLPEETRRLGCNPDFNAWLGDRNPSPDSSGTMRTASGHIHIGWGKNKDIHDKDHLQDCFILAKQLDYYLGIYSLIWDGDTKRRSLYGKAGTFRPKEYGIEYRTLSNRWLSDKVLMAFVFDAAFYCISHLLNGQDQMEDKFKSLAREVIDGNVPWWKDSKHPFHQVASGTGLSWTQLLQLEDPVWKTEKVSEAVKPEKKKRVSNFKYAG